eukprot:GHUV01034357.1.p3 GENE.GHUV01034357.1~~GHUV01034357.1.p3  ORF type:complete len:100 (-),score=1.98 GHUV01034357.1:426-725(-)
MCSPGAVSKIKPPDLFNRLSPSQSSVYKVWSNRGMTESLPSQKENQAESRGTTIVSSSNLKSTNRFSAAMLSAYCGFFTSCSLLISGRKIFLAMYSSRL